MQIDIAIRYIKVFVLSIIQSLTEFIPVSSSGHLLIISNFLNIDNLEIKLLNIIIQLSSTLALCLFFRKKLTNIILTLNTKNSRRLIYNFFIAFLPCAIIGLLFYKCIKVYLQSNIITASMLILGGLIILVIEKFNIAPKFNNIEDINKTTSLKIGLYQILSMIPGVSRSGSTIIGSLISGLNRKTAVEFSFILAIPTILSATVFDLYKNINILTLDNLNIILFSFFTTFIFSLLVIKFFLDYISNHNFKIFGYYRIFIGALIFLILFLQ